MKKVITIILCVLLCIGVIGGSFALAKVFDNNTSVEQPNDSSQDLTDDGEGDSSSDEGNDTVTETAQVWTLCDSTTQFAVGDKIVIAVQSEEKALGTSQNTSNRSYASVVKSGDTITFGDDVQIITLEAGLVENTFAFNVGTGYLYAASSSSNVLKTHDSIDENSSWSIEIDANGVASIVANGAATRNVLMYNSLSTLFSCYSSSTYQDPIVVYKLTETQIETEVVE